jgi:SNF2 family DNA or RNA helicase
MTISSTQGRSITISYDPSRIVGRLVTSEEGETSIWDRLKARLLEDDAARQLSPTELEFPWPSVLGILRDFGSKAQQQAFGFRFRFEGDAGRMAQQFATEFRQSRAAQSAALPTVTLSDIETKLKEQGFVRRQLRWFQNRDLLHLLTLRHGANFSVPGAGKTTVTFALHLLTRTADSHLLVVGPKASFPAWNAVIEECIDPSIGTPDLEPFTMLDGTVAENERLLASGAKRFLISYDLMVRQQAALSAYLSRKPVHVVLDEAHRMKAGFDSQRGSFLLNVSPLLFRRDILTGTPMPQGAQDIAAQLGFLWPGQGFDLQLQRGEKPRSVLGDLYVRTTKAELGLPPVTRLFIDVKMHPGQLALYSVVRNETLRKLARALSATKNDGDYLRARRSVMRLLQLSVNPILALKSITSEVTGLESGIVQTVLDEGTSAKMQAVVDHARQLAHEGHKVVIWTIFTETILELERLLADLNPVSIYGQVPSGLPTDSNTREGILKRFHEDSNCMVLIANPAAAGEGISLHTVCHNAIYLDRSYVSTHYLQSIDRIHRLGLEPNTVTNIFIYRTKAPANIGSIDYSVSRRLANKIRGLQDLLNDTDLHEIAFDEENADDPVDYAVDLQDLVDLVEELNGRRGANVEEGELE